MMLMRTNGLTTARDLMNLVTGDVFGGFVQEARDGGLPIDLLQKDGDIIVRASLPGFEKDEISVTIDRGVLKISAEHGSSSEPSTDDDDARNGEAERYYCRERRHTSLERSVKPPGQVD